MSGRCDTQPLFLRYWSTPGQAELIYYIVRMYVFIFQFSGQYCLRISMMGGNKNI